MEALNSSSSSAAKPAEQRSPVVDDHSRVSTHEEELSSEITEERRGIRGAAVIAAFAVGLLFLGWLAFYFGLFMRRGYVG